MKWINAREQKPLHMQRCLCWDGFENQPRIYVYDDISKYWCSQETSEHDENGDNHISDYGDYRITHWASVSSIFPPQL